MARIEATGLVKHYGAKTAVDDLSFTVEPGRVTGFLGPNGAGKSTTMRLMLELDYGQGTTRYDGHRYDEFKHPMRHVGVVLEAKAFHPSRTARNHLRMLAAANGLGKNRVDEVLAYVGLSEVGRQRPKEFSLGMGQRLGLAAALLGDPHTLILDEPGNGLDPQGITWLRNFLKAYASEGRSVFVSSHLLAEMALMADDLVVIGKGKLIASGPVEGFIQSASGTTVRVRTPDPQRLVDAFRDRPVEVENREGELHIRGCEQSEVGEIAYRAGVVLHELTTQVASLEDAFLEATEGSEEYVAQLAGSPDSGANGGPTGGPNGSGGDPSEGSAPGSATPVVASPDGDRAARQPAATAVDTSTSTTTPTTATTPTAANEFGGRS